MDSNNNINNNNNNSGSNKRATRARTQRVNKQNVFVVVVEIKAFNQRGSSIQGTHTYTSKHADARTK